jgi:hypothetical protein
MVDKKDNIDSGIGRFFILIFFFFLLSLSKNDSHLNSDYQNLSFTQIAWSNNYATLVEPTSLPVYNISLENCNSFDVESWKSKHNLATANKIVNQQLNTAELKFCDLKPNLLRLQLTYLHITTAEDYLLIS